MNIKKRLFLSFALVSAAGLTKAMQRTDEEILNDVHIVAYREKEHGELWVGKLSDGRVLAFRHFLVGPDSGRIEVAGHAGHAGGILPGGYADTINNFKTEQSKQEAINYLRQKYYSQQPSHRLTQ